MKRIYLILLLFLICTTFIYSQEKSSASFYHWELAAGGTSYYVSKANNWNFGPELSVLYAFTRTKGLYLTFSYPVTRLTSRGYGFREGFSSDLGGWISPRSMTPWLKLGVGLSHIFGSDSDGSQIGDTGLHISGHASYAITKRFSLWIRSVFRYWLSDRSHDSKISSSFSAGIGFRF